MVTLLAGCSLFFVKRSAVGRPGCVSKGMFPLAQLFIMPTKNGLEWREFWDFMCNYASKEEAIFAARRVDFESWLPYKDHAVQAEVVRGAPLETLQSLYRNGTISIQAFELVAGELAPRPKINGRRKALNYARKQKSP